MMMIVRLLATLLLLLAAADVSALGVQVTRRHLVVAAAAAPASVVLLPRRAALASVAAAAAEADLLKDLEAAKQTLVALPKMVGDQQWDPVRNELRKPAVNALWNAMDSSNTLRKLAKSRGDPDIFEAAEDVARNLRDVDGIVYSNGFSMEGKMAGAGLRGDGSGVGGKAQGSGGGQYRIKEPQALLMEAINSIDQVLALE